MYSSLYGQCIFSTKTAASTALADELLAAAKSPLFAASALKLQADFNKTLLDYETTYWNLTSVGRTFTGLPRTPKCPCLCHAPWLLMNIKYLEVTAVQSLHALA